MKTIAIILLLASMLFSGSDSLIGVWNLAEKDAESFITFGNGVLVLNKNIYNYRIADDTVMVNNIPLFVFVGSESYLIVRFLDDSTNYEFLFKR